MFETLGGFVVFTNLPQIIIDWEVSKVARKRLQRGFLQRCKNKNRPDSWRIVFWVDRFSANGEITRGRESITFGTIEDYPTEKAARLKADQILIEAGINSSQYRPSRRAMFEEVVYLYKHDILPLSKESTQASEKSRIDKYLLPTFGKINLELIGNQIIQSAVRKWSQDDELSLKSIKNIIITMMTILKVAKDWGFEVGHFDINTIKMPRRTLKPVGKSFTIEQAREIIRLTPYPFNIMMTTALLTGLRMGELLGLMWSNVDLEKGLLRVTQTVWQKKLQTPKSSESERTVPIPESLVELLREYKNDCPINKYGLLWANTAGLPLDGDNLRHRVLRPILDELGIIDKIGFHGFRHLHGSLLVSQGANIKIAQQQLGHADSKTTMELYVDVIGNDHRDAIEKLATVLSQKNTKSSAHKKTATEDLS